MLEPALVVEGRLLVDPGVTGVNVRLRQDGARPGRLVLPGFPAIAPGDRYEPAGDDGRFGFSRVEPGRYEVAVSIDPTRPPLARVDGVEPAPAGSAPDALVLDLRGRLVAARVRARGADGNLLQDIDVAIRTVDAASDAPWTLVAPSPEGDARFLVEALPIDVLVNAAGHRERRVRLEVADAVVELARAPQLRLVFDPPLPTLPDGVRWALDLDSVDGDVWRTVDLTPTPEGWVGAIGASGRYRIQTRLVTGSWSEWRGLDDDDDGSIDLDVDALPTTLVRPPPKAFERWAAELWAERESDR